MRTRMTGKVLLLVAVVMMAVGSLGLAFMKDLRFRQERQITDRADGIMRSSSGAGYIKK